MQRHGIEGHGAGFREAVSRPPSVNVGAQAHPPHSPTQQHIHRRPQFTLLGTDDSQFPAIVPEEAEEFGRVVAGLPRVVWVEIRLREDCHERSSRRVRTIFAVRDVRYSFEKVDVTISGLGLRCRPRHWWLGELSDMQPLPLYIVDPINPHHFIGKQTFAMYKVKNVFKLAYDVLSVKASDPDQTVGDLASLLGKISPL
jgi:hypothetical protein